MMTVIGVLLALAGILLIVSFVLGRVKSRAAVEATVSGLMVKTIHLRGTKVKQYTPEVTYMVDGKEYKEKADVSTFKKDKYSEGQKVRVYVDPKRPEAVRFGSGAGFLAAGLILLLAGILVIAA